MTWKIPLFKMYWDQDDIDNVSKILRSGMNWAVGPDVTQFERGLAGYAGTKYCLTFNSGTSALHAALAAYGIGEGDEVIVPSFTFIATANASKFVGARPVFADIEEKTFGLNPDDVMEKITKKTRVILPVHYGGCPCNIAALREIADDHNLVLLEDAAEALGAKVGDRRVGTFGDSGMFSFCQNKIITTGEGGAIVTDSRDLFEKMKLLRSHGRLETCDYFSTSAVMDYISIGYNLRMSNITAALGVAQLKKIETIIKIRRELAAQYTRKLNRAVPVIIVPNVPPSYFPVYQLFSVIVPDRDNLIKHLDNEGIMSKVYFSPVHQTSYYQKVLQYRDALPVTEKIAASIISLPFYPGMPASEIDSIIGAISEFYGE
jgi:perosamine synthetase